MGVKQIMKRMLFQKAGAVAEKDLLPKLLNCLQEGHCLEKVHHYSEENGTFWNSLERSLPIWHIPSIFLANCE